MRGGGGCRLVSPVVNTELCAPSSSSYYPFLCLFFFYYYRYYIMDTRIYEYPSFYFRGFTIDDNMSFFYCLITANNQRSIIFFVLSIKYDIILLDGNQN